MGREEGNTRGDGEIGKNNEWWEGGPNDEPRLAGTITDDLGQMKDPSAGTDDHQWRQHVCEEQMSTGTDREGKEGPNNRTNGISRNCPAPRSQDFELN